MICSATDETLGVTTATGGAFQVGFHPNFGGVSSDEALASAVGALGCNPSMPLARAKSLLATLNPDANILTDTSLSNTSLNANSNTQNFIFENCIAPTSSVSVVTSSGGPGVTVTGAGGGGGGGSSGGGVYGGVAGGDGGGSQGAAILPPLYPMPIRRGTSSQFKQQLFGEDDTNSNAEQQNGTTITTTRTSNETSLPVMRPSSVDSNSVKNGGTARPPKTYVATPEQVMKYYMNKLTPYEHKEIFTYSHIYFIGANAKKKPGNIEGGSASGANFGYDDHQGSYIHIPHDHIQYRYEVLKVIGKGSFGQVLKAYDHKNHMHIALKIVRNEKRFHRQAQEEIRILEHLRKQDKDNTVNIIHMYDHFNFRCHTCITFELLSINLYELIKKNKFMGFSLQLVRKFAHSLLFCLDTLHKNKIIHCDMKPENVLLKQQGRSGIKVS